MAGHTGPTGEHAGHRGNRRWTDPGRRLAALALSLALGGGALGAIGSGAAAATRHKNASHGSANKAPVKIAFLWPETGPIALPGRNNNVMLAVHQLNAHGGIDGHPVQWTAYDTGISPQQAVTAVQQALANHPTVMVGLIIDEQVAAAAQAIKQSGIPLIEGAEGPAATSTLLHVPNIYTVVPVTYMAVEASVQYAYSKYHPKTVGIFHTDDIAANDNVVLTERLLRKDGVKHFIVQKVSSSATDASEQALAMKSADVIFAYGFPQVTSVFVNDLSHDGSTKPIIGDQGFDGIVGAGLDSSAALKNTIYTTYCTPDVLSTHAAKAYVSAYKSAYPGTATTVLSNPYVYDAVEIAAHAIKADGGNLAPSAVNKALAHLSYQGACGPYKIDSNHDLMHQVALISVKDGTNHLTLAKLAKEKPATVKELKDMANASSS